MIIGLFYFILFWFHGFHYHYNYQGWHRRIVSHNPRRLHLYYQNISSDVINLSEDRQSEFHSKWRLRSAVTDFFHRPFRRVSARLATFRHDIRCVFALSAGAWVIYGLRYVVFHLIQYFKVPLFPRTVLLSLTVCDSHDGWSLHPT